MMIQSLKLTAFVIFILSQTFSLAVRAGGGDSSGGGDPVSQEALARISQLPALVTKLGQKNFPEVDLRALQTMINSGIRIQLRTNISIDGATKSSQFTKPDLIELDPVKWREFEMDPTNLRQQFLLAHEVFGLMDIESNNDYHVSSRILALGLLNSQGFLPGINQITSIDLDDPQSIYWVIDSSNRIQYYYCKDRFDLTTCKLLDPRSFTLEQVREAVQPYLSRLNGLRMVRNGFAVAAAPFLFYTIVRNGGHIIPIRLLIATGVPALVSAYFTLLFENEQNYQHMLNSSSGVTRVRIYELATEFREFLATIP